MTTKFEGHQGKEPSNAMFHPKASVQAAGTPSKVIQGFKKTGKRFARKPAPPSLD